MDSKHRNRATLIGLVAVVLWSSIVGLIRGVSESFGATGGAALMYTVASVFLLFSVGFPRLGTFPKRYLYLGSTLFVAYELCLSLSIGYANTARQAIEVGMVNYLWPTFTLVAAIVFNKQRASLWVVPGFFLSMLGICWVLGGERGLDLAGMAANVLDNPLSYGLAFSGAVIWAAYCTVTTRHAQGKNGVTFFFMLVAIVLWVKYWLAGDGSEMHMSTSGIVFLLLAAGAMGFGYAAWNVGILGGNVTLLAGASYFIPVFSAALSAVLLHAPLSFEFWQGAAMVCGGSILCWIATRTKRARPGNAAAVDTAE
jgi:drug/metabolite transporter (DMT)-like permease